MSIYYKGPRLLHRCAKCGWAGRRAKFSAHLRRECPKCGHWKPERVQTDEFDKPVVDKPSR